MATIVVLFQRATVTPNATRSPTPRPTSPPVVDAAPAADAAGEPSEQAAAAPPADIDRAAAAEPGDLGDQIRAQVAEQVAAAGVPDRGTNDSPGRRRDDD
jgi:hypothetical protein